MKRGGRSRSDQIVDSDVEGVGQFFEGVDGTCLAPRFDVSDGDPMHAGFSGQLPWSRDLSQQDWYFVPTTQRGMSLGRGGAETDRDQ